RDEVHHLGRRVAGEPGCARVPAKDDAAWHASLRRAPGTALERIASFGLLACSARHPDVFLRLRLPGDIAERFLQAVESRRRRLAERVEHVSWYEPWPDPDAPGSVLAARTFSTASRR